MGRPSKLNDKQRAEIERRLLAGEKPAALAKEFKVSRSSISRGFSQNVQNVQNVAAQLVRADVALKALPAVQQRQAVSLAEELRAISGHLASAGRYGAKTAHRLSGIANEQSEKVDDANPLTSRDAVASIAMLTKLANDAAEIGLNLLRANKEAVDNMSKEKESPPEPKQIVFTVADASA